MAARPCAPAQLASALTGVLRATLLLISHTGPGGLRVTWETRPKSQCISDPGPDVPTSWPACWSRARMATVGGSSHAFPLGSVGKNVSHGQQAVTAGLSPLTMTECLSRENSGPSCPLGAPGPSDPLLLTLSPPTHRLEDTVPFWTPLEPGLRHPPNQACRGKAGVGTWDSEATPASG